MDDAIDAPRVSLLDIVQERIQKEGKRPMITRLMYAAKISGKETNKIRLTAYHEQLLQKHKGDTEKPTGFLLIYPTCCLHIIEAETRVIMGVLRAVHAEAEELKKKDKTRLLESVKVLSCTEDIPFRAWPTWASLFINSTNSGPYDAEEPPKLLPAVGSLNVNMIKLGLRVTERSQHSIDSIKASAADLLPSGPETIFGLLLAPGVPSLEDFLKIYDSPVDVDLESDNVWPMPQILQF